MTLDEAIKHAEEVVKKQENNAKNYPRPNKSVKGSGRMHNDYLKCAEEHRQLAEWLKDYKRLLEQDDTVPFDFDLYQAGLMDMPKEMIEVLDKIRAEIEGNMESIIGKYDSSIPKFNMPSYKIERNKAREECISIIDKYKAKGGE